MIGMFICFVLPGILVGLLLSQGSKTAAKHARKRRGSQQQPQRVAVRRPVKGQLYVYDLKGDYAGSEAA